MPRNDRPAIPESRRDAARRRRRVLRSIRKLARWGVIDWHERDRMIDYLASRCA